MREWYTSLWGGKIPRDSVVAFCRRHRVHLNAAQLKKKGCLGKGCRYLKKWECPFWDERERWREIKKLKKEQGVPVWQKVEIRTDRNGKVLPKTRKKR